MNKTYQPFIIEKADEILEILKDDIVPFDHARERLCMLLTEKFINGKLSSEDDVRTVFESEEELLRFVNECYIYENLLSLMEQGLVGMYEDDDNEELFFLTEKGKLYMDVIKKKG
jgi:hypothetical protein